MGTRVTPHNPFDIFEGKLFHFFIKMEGGFQNYDNSGFLDEKSSILIDGQPVKKAKENFEKVLTFLSENSPNLMAHEYQAWDEETKDFVLDTIQAILPPGRLLSTIMKKSGIKTMEDVEVVTERTKTTTRSSSIPQINISEEIDDTEVEEEDDELSEIDEFLSKTKSNNKPSKAKASFFEED
jgi:hypothetical protein